MQDSSKSELNCFKFLQGNDSVISNKQFTLSSENNNVMMIKEQDNRQEINQ